MRKWIALLVGVAIPAVLTAVLAGRFTPLHVIAWAVFYGSMFAPYTVGNRWQLACRWPKGLGR